MMHPVQDQNFLLSQTKLLEDYALYSGTSPFWLYMGVPLWVEPFHAPLAKSLLLRYQALWS